MTRAWSSVLDLVFEVLDAEDAVLDVEGLEDEVEVLDIEDEVLVMEDDVEDRGRRPLCRGRGHRSSTSRTAS